MPFAWFHNADDTLYGERNLRLTLDKNWTSWVPPLREIPLPSLQDDVQAPLPQLPAGRVRSFLPLRGGVVGVLLLASRGHPRPHRAAHHRSADHHFPVFRRPVSSSNAVTECFIQDVNQTVIDLTTLQTDNQRDVHLDCFNLEVWPSWKSDYSVVFVQEKLTLGLNMTVMD